MIKAAKLYCLFSTHENSKPNIYSSGPSISILAVALTWI